MENRFYVYALIDLSKKGNYDYNGLKFKCEPFYIGKGTKDRLYHHFDKIDTWFTSDGKIKFIKVVNKKENKEKLQLSKDLLNLGYKKEQIAIKLVDDLVEEVALELEKEYIDKIGRLFFESGPLTNIADGGVGGNTLSPDMCKQRSIDYSGTRHPLSKYKYRFINNKGEIFEPESNKEFCEKYIPYLHHLQISKKLQYKKIPIISYASWTIEKQNKEKEFTQNKYIETHSKYYYEFLNDDDKYFWVIDEEVKAFCRGKRLGWRCIVDAFNNTDIEILEHKNYIITRNDKYL